MVAMNSQVSSGVCFCLHRSAGVRPSGQLCVLCGGLAGSAANHGVQKFASTIYARERGGTRHAQSAQSRSVHARLHQYLCFSRCFT